MGLKPLQRIGLEEMIFRVQQDAMRFVENMADLVEPRFRRRCAFPGCGEEIPAKHRLCRNHFKAASRYGREYRDEWTAKDVKSDAFYVYILELDDGTLYAGQTRNLLRRMQEHCDGTTKTTAGRHPLLAWFEQVPTRQAAVEKEADLKHRIDTQPSEVRQMIAAFRRR